MLHLLDLGIFTVAFLRTSMDASFPPTPTSPYPLNVVLCQNIECALTTIVKMHEGHVADLNAVCAESPNSSTDIEDECHRSR